jgi:hypothetical protein
VAAGFILGEVLCTAKLGESLIHLPNRSPFLFIVPEITAANTWGKAVGLWFWTNVGGTIGLLIATHGALFIVEVVGMIAALVSSPAILLAYPAFGQLLTIPQRWLRLSCTALLIVATVSLTVLVATVLVKAGSPSWWEAMALVGWAYGLAALIATAALYQPALLRPDDLIDSDGTADPSN